VDLRRSGRLLQPQAGDDIVTEFVRLSSPHQAFLADCCETGPDKSCACAEVFKAWEMWCRDNGHEVGSATSFGTKLRAAVAGLEKVRVRVGGQLPYYYRGLRLKEEVAARVNNHVHVLGA